MLNERAFCHHVKLQPFAWQLQLTIKLCKPKIQTSKKHVQNTNYSVFMIYLFFIFFFPHAVKESMDFELTTGLHSGHHKILLILLKS